MVESEPIREEFESNAFNSLPPVLEWWQAILLVGAVWLLSLVMSTVTGPFISVKWVAVISEIVAYFFPVVLLVYFSKLRRAGIYKLLGLSDLRLVVLIPIVGVGYTVSSSVFVDIAHMIRPIPESLVDLMFGLLHADSIPGLIAVFFIAAVSPAVAEELLFRGVVQPALIARIGPAAGIGVTAFLFASIHLNPWSFIPLVIAGTFFGFVTYKTGTFWAGALAHFGYNLIAVVEASRIDNLDYARLTERLPWYIFIPGLAVAVIGTIVLWKMSSRLNRTREPELEPDR